MQRVREESARRHLVYLRDGQPDVIGLFPLPLTVLPDQLSYLHFVSLTIQNALKRLPELYLQDFAVREVLRLPAGGRSVAAGNAGGRASARTTRSSAGSTR